MWLAVFIIAGVGLVWSFRRGPNAVWGGATLGLVVGLIWGFVVGEGFALILRGAAAGAVAGVGAELVALIPKLSRSAAQSREAREQRAGLIAMGLDPDNLPVPGSPEYKTLVERISGQVAEEMQKERRPS